MPILLQIAIGGAIGASLRHVVGQLFVRSFGTAFPWGTLSVNVAGSFLMGVAVSFLLRRSELGLQAFAPFLMTGILGGFTTFSTFSLETFLMLERGRAGLALLYVGGSVLLGLGAFAAAIALLRPAAGA